jgi:hypothetical protein
MRKKPSLLNHSTNKSTTPAPEKSMTPILPSLEESLNVEHELQQFGVHLEMLRQDWQHTKSRLEKRRQSSHGEHSLLDALEAADLENARLALELAAAKKKLMETAHLARPSERIRQRAVSLAEENNRLRKSALVVAGPTKASPPNVEPNVNWDIASGNRAKGSFAKSIFGALRRGRD